ISLGVCNKVCGGLSPLSWSIFFQQFTAWLLPWLALISQLPYGARTTRENILSMLLTIGSPTLALYSLAFTVLNGKYAPLRLSRVPGHLESLIALEVNDLWFKKFREMIEYEQNWGISAISSIGWVLLAYIFTVLDSFISFPQYAKNTGDLNENGEAVGTVWLWLLPIVVGWLQLSPKYHYSKICAAFKIANDYANVGDALSDQLTAHELEPFYLAEHTLRQIHIRRRSQHKPIFNFSRVLPWLEATETYLRLLNCARTKGQRRITVDDQDWRQVIDPSCTIKNIFGPPTPFHIDNRTGTPKQAIAYCAATSKKTESESCSQSENTYPPYNDLLRPRVSAWTTPGLLQNICLASMIALAVQWGTTGSAVVIVFYTPNVGLGCL
ncbi:hypothetical protein C8J56DRAFT_1092978, partial [Mycena floridula]